MASVIKMRGLPWGAREEDIACFFAPLPVGPESVTLITGSDGRASGEAFVWIHSENICEAMRRNRGHMGTRYIDLFRSTDEEYHEAVRRMGIHLPRADLSRPVAAPRVAGASPRHQDKGTRVDAAGGFGGRDFGARVDAAGGFGGRDFGSREFGDTGRVASDQRMPPPVECTDGIVRLRGLPFQCSAADVAAMYSSYFIDETMIYLKLYTTGMRLGQLNGDAYVRFADAEVADAAIMKCNRLTMSGRYVEMFPASEQELSTCAAAGGIVGYETNNPLFTEGQALAAAANTLVDREGSGWLRLRGLPFKATKSHVINFMTIASLQIPPEDVAFKLHSDGRHTGEAFVRVESLQVAETVSKALNRQTIGGRYIEVFLCTFEETKAVRGDRPTPYSRRFTNHRALTESRAETPASPYIVAAPVVT